MQSPDADIILEEALEREFTDFMGKAHLAALSMKLTPQQADLAVLSLLLNHMRADRADQEVADKIRDWKPS